METRGDVIRGIRAYTRRANGRDDKAVDPRLWRQREPTVPAALIAFPVVALIGIVIALVALSAVTARPSLTRAFIVTRPEESPPRIREAGPAQARPAPPAAERR